MLMGIVANMPAVRAFPRRVSCPSEHSRVADEIVDKDFSAGAGVVPSYGGGEDVRDIVAEGGSESMGLGCALLKSTLSSLTLIYRMLMMPHSMAQPHDDARFLKCDGTERHRGHSSLTSSK